MTTRDAWSPDLEMRVRTTNEHGRTRLIYTLHSPAGVADFFHQEIPGPTFQGSPEEYHARLLHKIERLGHGFDVDRSGLLRAEVDRKLTSLGRDLWRELFPAEIRYAYRDIRRNVRSWLIVSDEPWIPWELVKPYEDSRQEEIIEDDFLAFQFELTRWLAGSKAAVQEIVVHSFAAFRTGKDLPQAEEELTLLKAFARPGVLDATPAISSAGRFLRELESRDLDLIHFIGHGTYDSEQADEAGIPFPDGSVLRPVDLEGPLATRIGRSRPLVFLNTCWAGRQGWSATRLGGWAARWVGICGCGALIAPLWPVRDQAALSFAWAFYDALLRGCTLGEAALAARRFVREERHGDPSILAYAVYGHPNARLRLGGEAVTAEEGSERPAGLAPLPPLSVRRRVRTSLRPRKAVLAAASVAFVFALVLHLAAGPVLYRLYPMDRVPEPARDLPKAKPTPRPSPPPTAPEHNRERTRITTGGLSFEITGGQSRVNSALKQVLRKAAAPLDRDGISGWTISFELDKPQITSQTQEGFEMKSCRLTGEASARGPVGTIDLGPVSAINAQFDGAQACEAATKPLAEAVLTRFVNALGTKGTS